MFYWVFNNHHQEGETGPVETPEQPGGAGEGQWVDDGASQHPVQLHDEEFANVFLSLGINVANLNHHGMQPSAWLTSCQASPGLLCMVGLYCH